MLTLLYAEFRDLIVMLTSIILIVVAPSNGKQF
jgi:hypothetical protein